MRKYNLFYNFTENILGDIQILIGHLILIRTVLHRYHSQNIILRTTLSIFQDEPPSTSREIVEARVDNRNQDEMDEEEINEKQVAEEEIQGDEMGHGDTSLEANDDEAKNMV